MGLRPQRIAAICRAAILLGGFSIVTGAQAQTIFEALADGTPLADLRLRYEAIELTTKAKAASAATLRARLGYQTGLYAGFQGLAEIDVVQHFGPKHFNDTINGLTSYPAIPDPDLVALNRLQLGYALHLARNGDAPADLKLTLGRQRIVYGDARFIGNAGWRQHEQTYDAISLSDSSLPDTILSYAYVMRVNRVFGPRSPNADFDSHSQFFNAVYSGVPHAKLEAYAYLLDLRQAPLLSTATYGMRAETALDLGSGVAANANAAFARQQDYARNPLHVGLSYYLAEAGLAYAKFSGLLGYEVLQGNGVIGFQTPLASLHLFQGWAETFVNDPPNGVRDFYAKGNYALPAPPFLTRLGASLAYHDFSAEHVGTHYGSEWDAQLEAQAGPALIFDVAFAAYRSDGPFPGKNGFWCYATYRY
jgi:hypothetical protein